MEIRRKAPPRSKSPDNKPTSPKGSNRHSSPNMKQCVCGSHSSGDLCVCMESSDTEISKRVKPSSLRSSSPRSSSHRHSSQQHKHSSHRHGSPRHSSPRHSSQQHRHNSPRSNTPRHSSQHQTKLKNEQEINISNEPISDDEATKKEKEDSESIVEIEKNEPEDEPKEKPEEENEESDDDIEELINNQNQNQDDAKPLEQEIDLEENSAELEDSIRDMQEKIKINKTMKDNIKAWVRLLLTLFDTGSDILVAYQNYEDMMTNGVFKYYIVLIVFFIWFPSVLAGLRLYKHYGIKSVIFGALGLGFEHTIYMDYKHSTQATLFDLRESSIIEAVFESIPESGIQLYLFIIEKGSLSDQQKYLLLLSIVMSIIDIIYSFFEVDREFIIQNYGWRYGYGYDYTKKKLYGLFTSLITWRILSQVNRLALIVIVTAIDQTFGGVLFLFSLVIVRAFIIGYKHIRNEKNKMDWIMLLYMAPLRFFTEGNELENKAYRDLDINSILSSLEIIFIIPVFLFFDYDNEFYKLTKENKQTSGYLIILAVALLFVVLKMILHYKVIRKKLIFVDYIERPYDIMISTIEGLCQKATDKKLISLHSLLMKHTDSVQLRQYLFNTCIQYKRNRILSDILDEDVATRQATRRAHYFPRSFQGLNENSPLMTATRYRNWDAIRLLIKAKADASARSNFWITDMEEQYPIFLACKNNDIHSMYQLIPVSKVHQDVPRGMKISPHFMFRMNKYFKNKKPGPSIGEHLMYFWAGGGAILEMLSRELKKNPQYCRRLEEVKKKSHKHK